MPGRDDEIHVQSNSNWTARPLFCRLLIYIMCTFVCLFFFLTQPPRSPNHTHHRTSISVRSVAIAPYSCWPTSLTGGAQYSQYHVPMWNLNSKKILFLRVHIILKCGLFAHNTTYSTIGSVLLITLSAAMFAGADNRNFIIKLHTGSLMHARLEYDPVQCTRFSITTIFTRPATLTNERNALIIYVYKINIYAHDLYTQYYVHVHTYCVYI